jgi:hypothetical protein
MNKSIYARFLFLSTIYLLIGACAKISAPSGGLRDKLPPVAIKSIPEKNAINFTGKNISITFDEFVVLDNVSEKFMISPPMKKKPRVFLKGKNVNVEFYDDLKDSTTYTLYFQDAIKDLNEGNILENYQFVFSTGPVVDSLSVTGNVYNSFDLEVPEKTQVIMYHELADSAVVKHLPDYISQVDKNGFFRIDNVRAGEYRLYALKDGDNSKNYNLSDEKFAFMNAPIFVTPEKNFIPVAKDTVIIKKGAVKSPLLKGKKEEQGIVKDTLTAQKAETKIPRPVVVNAEYQLILFEARKKAHYLKNSSRDNKYQLSYILSLPPDSMKFEFSIPGNGRNTYFTERNTTNDTLTVWLTDSTLYSQTQITTLVKFPFTDTLGMLGYKTDTIPMRFLAPRAPRAAKVKKPVLSIEDNITGGLIKPGQSIVFTAKTPMVFPDTSLIRLYEFLDSTRRTISYVLNKDELSSCKYSLNANLQQGKRYLLIADSSSFRDIYNVCSDSAGIKFYIKDPESYSKLTLNIKNFEGPRIIQLLDNRERLIQEFRMEKDGKVVFPLLETGLYRVRAIYDINGDGKWTTGDFESGRQPEPVSYYPLEIEVKPGWELEQDWDIGVKNFKDQKLREKVK